MCVDSLPLFELPVSGGPRSARIRTRCRLCWAFACSIWARACTLVVGRKGVNPLIPVRRWAGQWLCVSVCLRF